jgi:hypothetical protein
MWFLGGGILVEELKAVMTSITSSLWEKALFPLDRGLGVEPPNAVDLL